MLRQDKQINKGKIKRTVKKTTPKKKVVKRKEKPKVYECLHCGRRSVYSQEIKDQVCICHNAFWVVNKTLEVI